MQVGNSYNLRFELIKQDGGGTNILKEIIPLVVLSPNHHGDLLSKDFALDAKGVAIILL